MGKQKMLLVCPKERYELVPNCFEQYVQDYFIVLPYDFLYVSASAMLSSLPGSPKTISFENEKWFRRKTNYTTQNIQNVDVILIINMEAKKNFSLHSFLAFQEEVKAVMASGKPYSYWDDKTLEEPSQKFLKRMI